MSLVFTQLTTFQCCLSCPDTSNTITIPTSLVWLWLGLTMGGEALAVMSVMSAGAGWCPSGASGAGGVSGAEEV